MIQFESGAVLSESSSAMCRRSPEAVRTARGRISMNFKKLFKRLFPSEGEFRIYLKWRADRKRELSRQRSIRRQQQERYTELLAMDDDIESDDFDDMNADVWQEVME